jgi:hypothetical protein
LKTATRNGKPPAFRSKPVPADSRLHLLQKYKGKTNQKNGYLAPNASPDTEPKPTSGGQADALKLLATELPSYTKPALAKAIKAGELIEVYEDD